MPNTFTFEEAQQPETFGFEEATGTVPEITIPPGQEPLQMMGEGAPPAPVREWQFNQGITPATAPEGMQFDLGGPQALQTSKLGTFGREAAAGTIPTLAVAPGAAAGAELGGTLGLAGGPLAPITVPGGALLGGVAGAIAGPAMAEQMQEAAGEAIAPQSFEKLQELRAAGAEQHPWAAAAGGLAPAAAAFQIAPGQTIRGLATIPAALRGAASPAEQRLAAQAAMQLGFGAEQAFVQPKLEGRPITLPGTVAALGGALALGRSRIPERFYASSVPKAAEVHGNVQSLAREGQGQVPVQEGGPGVQPQAEGGLEAHPEVLLEHEVSPEEYQAQYEEQEREGMGVTGKTHKVTYEGSGADQATLGTIEGAAKANVESGLGGDVIVRDTAADPEQARGTMYADRANGKIVVHLDNLESETLGLSPQERKEFIERGIAHEGLHLATLSVLGREHWNSMSPVRQRIFMRQYWGTLGPSETYQKATPAEREAIMGNESLRADLERLLYGKPSERYGNVGFEKFTQAGLDLLSRVIAGWERLTRRSGNKVQRDIVNAYMEKLNVAREQAGMAPLIQPTAQPGMDEPFLPRRRETDEEVNRLASIGPQEFLKSIGNTESAYRLGLSLQHPDQVKQLRGAIDEARKQSTAAMQAGNFNEAMPAAMKAQFLREAVEAATGTGSAGFALSKERPGYTPPVPEGEPMAARRRPRPGEEPELFAEPITARGVPGQEKEERQRPAGLFQPQDITPANLEADARDYLKAASNPPSELKKVFEEGPNFQQWVQRMEGKFKGKPDEAQLRSKWAEVVNKHYDQARGEEVEQALRALNLMPRQRAPGVSLPFEQKVADPLIQAPILPGYEKDVTDAMAQTGMGRAQKAAQLRNQADAAEQWLKSGKNLSFHTKATLERLIAGRRASANILYSASSLRSPELVAAVKAGKYPPTALATGGELETVQQTGLPPEVKRLKAVVDRQQRSRATAIRRITEKLIDESYTGKENWNRTEVDATDLDYTRKGKQPAFNEIGKDLIGSKSLGDILTDDAGSDRTGKNAPPVSVTKRLTALVNPKTGEVYLVSTYRDGRRGAVLQDPDAPAKDTHVPLDTISKRYRPFASLLLKEPVQNFRMKFEDVEDFNSKVADEARAGVSDVAGEYEFGVPMEAPQERGEVLPEEAESMAAGGEEEAVEGLPSTKILKGEGGGFMGPEAELGRVLTAPKPMTAQAPLLDSEVNAVFEDAKFEQGDIETQKQMSDWVEGVLDAMKRKDATPRQRVAFMALAKSAQNLIDEQAVGSPEAAWARVLDYYYDILKNHPKTGETVSRVVGFFTPEARPTRSATLEQTLQRQAVEKGVAQVRPEARPAVEPRTEPVLGPADIPEYGRFTPDFPPKGYEVGARRVTSITAPPEPTPPPPSEFERATRLRESEAPTLDQPEFPFQDPRQYAPETPTPTGTQFREIRKLPTRHPKTPGIDQPQSATRRTPREVLEEQYDYAKRALSAAFSRREATDKIYALRDGMQQAGNIEADQVKQSVREAAMNPGKQTKETLARATNVRKAVQAVIATGEISIRKPKGEGIPPMIRLEQLLEKARSLTKRPDAASQTAGKELRAIANKLKAAGKELLEPEDIAEAEKAYRERMIWAPSKGKLDELITKAENAEKSAAIMMKSLQPAVRAVGRKWLKAATELKESAKFAKENWDTKDLQRAVNQTRKELNFHFEFAREQGMKLPYRLNYFPNRYEALWNGNSVQFGPMNILGRNFRRPRVFNNLYEAIEAGPYIPVNIDAADLASHRVRQGLSEINKASWLEMLKKLEDPETRMPVVVDSIKAPGGPKMPGEAGTYQAFSLGPGKKTYGVIPEFHPALQMASGEVAEFTSPIGKAALHYTRQLKHGALLIYDTFHPGRLGQYYLSVIGLKNPGAWRGALSALEYREQDLDRAIANGSITKEDADWSRTKVEVNVAGGKKVMSYRDILENAVVYGANVGRLSDALYGEVKHLMPGVTTLNKLVFQKFTRGIMAETLVRKFLQYNRENPGVNADKLMRDVVKDTNFRFGSIGRQGFIKDPFYKGLAEIFTLAPGWVEGLIQTEMRAYGRFTGISNVTGRRGLPQLGVIGSSVGKGLLTYFALAQALNLWSRGQPTWKNKEKGHKLDAWIPYGPGEGEGFWLSPLAVFAEVTHDLYRLMETKPTAWEAIRQVGFNKLGPWGRLAAVLGTRETPFGERITSAGGLAREAAKSVAPIPITASWPIQYLGHQAAPNLFRAPRPGQFWQQALASGAGIKVTPGQSAVRQITDLAKDYVTKTKAKPESFVIVPTTEPGMTRMFDAIDQGDDRGAAAIYQRLKERDPMIFRKILEQAGAQARHPFTGSHHAEAGFKLSLGAGQLQLYNEAQRERMMRYQKVVAFLMKR